MRAASATLRHVQDTLAGIKDEYLQLMNTFVNDTSVRSRLVGVGVITPEDAHKFGMVGPFARASNLNNDVRRLGNGGYKYLSDFQPILATDGDCMARVEVRAKEVLQSTTIDESRILTEAAIYADKIAVDEETVRLRSHVSQLRGMIASDEPMGRKMDFLIQEVNRESNTVGSKCNDVEIARVVVELKAEVEKIREQVQNIE